MTQYFHYRIYVLFLFLVCCYPINAQVTIGSAEPGVIGSLLDLKSYSPDANNTTSQKGLLLPRVNLVKKADLAPTTTTTEQSKTLHTGLWVYNLTTNEIEDLCPGPYIWTGNLWQKMGDPCKVPESLSLSPSLLVFRSGQDKSAADGSFTPLSFTTNWTPASSTISIANPLATVGGGISGYTPTASIAATGSFTENVSINKMNATEVAANPFLIKESSVNVTLAGSSLSQAVTLRQVNYAITSDKDIINVNAASTNVATFTLSSNVNWAIDKAYQDPNNIISSISLLSGGANDVVTNTLITVNLNQPAGSNVLVAKIRLYDSSATPKALDKFVEIRLTPVILESLNVSPSILDFRSGQDMSSTDGSFTPLSFTSNWTPVSSTISIANPVATQGGGISGYTPTTSIPATGSFTENVSINAMNTTEVTNNPFLVKESKVKVALAGSSLTQDVTLRQTNYAITTDADEYTITLKAVATKDLAISVGANVGWTVSATSNASFVSGFSSSAGGTDGTITQTNLTVTMKKPTSTAPKQEVMLTFTDPTKKAKDKIVKITVLNGDSGTGIAGTSGSWIGAVNTVQDFNNCAAGDKQPQNDPIAQKEAFKLSCASIGPGWRLATLAELKAYQKTNPSAFNQYRLGYWANDSYPYSCGSAYSYENTSYPSGSTWTTSTRTKSSGLSVICVYGGN